MMNAVPDFRGRVGNVLRVQALIDRLPGLSPVVGPEGACRRDGDVNPPVIRRIENDGVQAHPARARLPCRSGAMAAQAGKFMPVLSAVRGAKQCSVFNTGVYGFGISERGLDVPDPLKLP